MKAFKDYDSTSEYTESVKLPAGAYEVTIKRAEDSNDALCILFDISEGEYKNYFMDKFSSDRKNYPENAKFKGVLRLWDENGEQFDEDRKRRRKTVLKLIKEENKLNVDYTKEWDGAALKGAKIGMIFRDQEYNYNGYHGFTAQPYGVISLEALRTGKYKIPEPKRLKGSTSASSYTNVETYADLPTDDDLPF